MTALVEISENQKNIGNLQAFTCEAGSTHLTFPVCEQHEDRGGIYVIAHFPSLLSWGYRICLSKQHLFTKLPSGY